MILVNGSNKHNQGTESCNHHPPRQHHHEDGVAFHIVGDAYVDFLCFLSGDWPERGGDSRLYHAVEMCAGGSSTNTATHLQSLLQQADKESQNDDADDVEDDPVPYPHDDRTHEDGQQEINNNNHVNAHHHHHNKTVTLYTVLNEHDNYGKLLLKHADRHGFPLVNCWQTTDDVSTGHCMAIVGDGERSFMTHQGCVEHFSADHVPLDPFLVDPIAHVHVAGFFNVTGFWHGHLQRKLQEIRSNRELLYPQGRTVVSLVTQHDATKEWDGGLLQQVLPLLDILIMNELEANRMLQHGRGSHVPLNSMEEWVSYFTPYNPDAVIVVTLGAEGAVAFSNYQIIAAVRPACKVTVVDPTGAGDSFTAGFLHGLWDHHLRAGSVPSSLVEATASSSSSSSPPTGSSTHPTPFFAPESIQHGLNWGCAVGTAAVMIRGASNPAKRQDILDLYHSQMSKAGADSM